MAMGALKVLLPVLGLGITLALVASSDPFPRGVLTELQSPRDVYRFGRIRSFPLAVLAYAGDKGAALRDALAARAGELPEAIFVAADLEGILGQVPASVFAESPAPELAEPGLSTIVLAFNRSGSRRRWTAAAGELHEEPSTQAESVLEFLRSA